MSVRELEKLCRRENELKFNVKQSQKQSTRLAFYDHAEQELRNFLCGHEARICTKKDNKGTLEIDFNNEDELKDIFKTLDIF
jgi:hypothetical protein